MKTDKEKQVRHFKPRVDRPRGKDIDGIILLDKPFGITSNDALQKVKRLFSAKKAGHGGTLDPIATGLLVICLGEATKFSRFLLEANKHYLVTAQLGVKTASGDSEGEVIQTAEVSAFSDADIERALTTFRGQIEQTPSMFSAIKYQGQPLYKLARQGVEVPRASRPVTIETFTLLSRTETTLTMEIKASKGTYVRTLVDDLGDLLGCGAHVTSLRRLGIGPYVEEQMVTLPYLESVAKGEAEGVSLNDCLLPLDSSVSTWPKLTLSEAAAYYLIQGQPVIVPYSPTEGWVRLVGRDGRFLGVGEILDDGRVAPRRLVASSLMKKAV